MALLLLEHSLIRLYDIARRVILLEGLLNPVYIHTAEDLFG